MRWGNARFIYQYLQSLHTYLNPWQGFLFILVPRRRTERGGHKVRQRKEDGKGWKGEEEERRNKERGGRKEEEGKIELYGWQAGPSRASVHLFAPLSCALFTTFIRLRFQFRQHDKSSSPTCPSLPLAAPRWSTPPIVFRLIQITLPCVVLSK